MGLTMPNLTYSQNAGVQPSTVDNTASGTGTPTATAQTSKSAGWLNFATSLLSSSNSSQAQPQSTVDVNNVLNNSAPKTNPVVYIAIIVILFVVVISGVLIYKATKK